MPYESLRDVHATDMPSTGEPVAGEMPPSSDLDYGSIHDAVMGTERGRWFLLQYAARNRNADTEAVLAALERVEQSIREARAAAPAEIPSPIPPQEPAPAAAKTTAARGKTFGALFSTVAAIRDAVEHIQEISRFMHEHDLDRALCANLDAAAAEITRACIRIERGSGGGRAPAPEADLPVDLPAAIAADESGSPLEASGPEAAVSIAETVSAAETIPYESPAPEISVPIGGEAAILAVPPMPDESVETSLADSTAERPEPLAAQAERAPIEAQPAPATETLIEPAEQAPPAPPAPAAISDAGFAAKSGIASDIKPDILSDAAKLFPPVSRPQIRPDANRGGWLSELLAKGALQTPPAQPAPQIRTEVQPIWPATPKNPQPAPAQSPARSAPVSGPAQVVPMPRPAPAAAEHKPAPAQSDPLASLAALSDEEKIALFR